MLSGSETTGSNGLSARATTVVYDQKPRSSVDEKSSRSASPGTAASSPLSRKAPSTALSSW
jgi:hypothetical protein